MLLVLEGPDLGGKSTVGRWIYSLIGLEPKHYGAKPSTREEMLARVESYPQNGVIDRHTFISEHVYSTCCADREPLVTKQELLEYVLTYQPLIVYCSPPYEYLIDKLMLIRTTDKAYKTRTHRDSVIENYRRIYLHYCEIMWELARLTPVLQIDFRHDKHILEEFLNEHFRHQ
jgi:hypothetical protein